MLFALSIKKLRVSNFQKRYLTVFKIHGIIFTLNIGKISFLMDVLYLVESLPFGIADYLYCLHNIIDLGIISSLPLFLVFCWNDSPLQWYFASILYFLRALEVVKLLTVSPFGIYVHTIWTTLSGDLPKFLVIVGLSLFTFSGKSYSIKIIH